MVGGSISEATGGKFVTGAITGAFSRAFNGEAHEGVNETPGRFVCQSDCSHTSEVEAHKAAAAAYYSLSADANKEYGWHVYEHSDGTYTYTYPTIGTSKSVSHAGVYISKKGNYNYVSSGHTHIDNNNQFSGQDIHYVTQRSKSFKDDRRLFLAAPNGNLYRLSSRNAIRSSRFAPGSKIDFISNYNGLKHLPSNRSDNLGEY